MQGDGKANHQGDMVLDPQQILHHKPVEEGNATDGKAIKLHKYKDGIAPLGSQEDGTTYHSQTPTDLDPGERQ